MPVSDPDVSRPRLIRDARFLEAGRREIALRRGRHSITCSHSVRTRDRVCGRISHRFDNVKRARIRIHGANDGALFDASTGPRRPASIQARQWSFTLYMNATADNKLPFGNLPRLLISWVCSEAVQTGSREIVLGRNGPRTTPVRT